MDPGPGFLECRESLDRLALADDRLVIDLFLVDQHSCFFPGCRESALRASRDMVRAPSTPGRLG